MKSVVFGRPNIFTPPYFTTRKQISSKSSRPDTADISADVPPALPDKREDFEAYADKVYGKKEKEQAIKENEAKLNANEKWRLVGKTAEIKCDDGKFYPLTMFNVGQLKAVLSKEEFADIKYIVQTELDKRQAE